MASAVGIPTISPLKEPENGFQIMPFWHKLTLEIQRLNYLDCYRCMAYTDTRNIVREGFSRKPSLQHTMSFASASYYLSLNEHAIECVHIYTNVKFKISYKPLFQSGIIWWDTKYRMLKDSSNSYMFKASFQYSEVWRKQVKQCCRLYTLLSTTLLFRATNWKERTNKPRNWWHNRAGRQQYTWEGTKDFGHQLAQIFLCSFSLEEWVLLGTLCQMNGSIPTTAGLGQKKLMRACVMLFIVWVCTLTCNLYKDDGWIWVPTNMGMNLTVNEFVI